jgi:hypothetical protein
MLAVMPLHRASAQVLLRYGWKNKGEFHSEDTVLMVQTIKLQGQTLDSEVRNEQRTLVRHGELDAEGNSLFRITREKMKADVTLADGTSVQYDSENPGQSPENVALAAVVDTYKALVGAEIVFKLDPSGLVKSIEGADEILAGKSAEVQAILKDQLSDESLKRAFEQQFDVLPLAPVEEGDFWSRPVTLDLGQGQSLNYKRRFDYLGMGEYEGHKVHKIRVTDTSVLFSIAATSPLPLDLLKSNLKIKSSKGMLCFEPQRGRMIYAEYDTQITGSLDFDAGGQEIPAELDLRMRSTFREVDDKK